MILTDTELLRWLEERTLPILGQDGDRTGVHGSGVLVRDGGHHFLVTASHVAKYFRQNADDLGLPLSPRKQDESPRLPRRLDYVSPATMAGVL
jgi:hypothetical protein